MAEIALAVVPIFFGALRGFKIVKEKVHLLRHYRKEVKWLRKRVEVQARCFKGEVHYVCIDTLDTQTAQSLIRDDEHAYWNSDALDATLRAHMGDLYDEFCEAMKEVKEALVQIEAKLAVFAPPDLATPLFHTTRDRFRVAFKKEEYKEDIGNLKVSIAELKRIRKLAKAVQRSSASRVERPQPENASVAAGVPEEDDLVAVRQYRESKHLSSSLQSLLSLHWSCATSAHLNHSGRLFLVGSVSERNSVLCLLESAGQQGSTVLSHRQLFAVSVTQMGLLTPDSLGRKSFDYPDGPPPKRQKRLSAQSQTRPDSASAVEDVASLCEDLVACSLGHSTEPARHTDVNQQRFEFEPKSSPVTSRVRWETSKMSSLADLLVCPVHDVILDRERILLALALVRGTLSNHSTEGWPKGCVLGGVGFLHDGTGEFDASAMLETLSMEIRVGGDGPTDTDMDGGSMVSEDELKYTYGVRNQVLYRLGVALLSIGLWTRVRWEDVGMVRRKAEAFDSLGGKRYREAVRRLISGEFGVDTNSLDDERLQTEIHRTIIVPLEKRAGLHRQKQSQGRVEGQEGKLRTQLAWSGKAAVRWDG
ncbi:hypothetical protein QBC39DRAFT_356579 [Podospora conica]|nr:hypothetical protein QBC39DRAFT_356579 [Schizothecium conicum]